MTFDGKLLQDIKDRVGKSVYRHQYIWYNGVWYELKPGSAEYTVVKK